ncbi:MAG TPA: wax ester/triacylglycerol synthase family O-acyltransferase [Solirubrobacteraceae bacterium]|nr:wax ester/triacylglycerol synthase family O-acyltransferase [Solirubrobacteraceae bacterium]
MSEQLSMLDTMFLELEQVDESAHMHIGAGLIFDPLPDGGTPDIGEFREQMRERMGILPRFAQQLSATHAGPLTWLTWEPAPAFDLDAHVHHATLPAPGGEAELLEWLGDFWSHRLDRRRPLWEITLLDGLQDGRWALATKTHHCLVDGVGSLDIGHLLLDATPDAELPPPTPLPARDSEAGDGRFWLSPGLVARGARAGVGAAVHPRASLEKVRAAVELVVRQEVLAAPKSSINGPMSGTRHFAAVRFDLDEMRAVKEQRGGTLNDLVLAVCAGGLRHLLEARGERPEGVLRAQVPVNIRSEDREHALGNELTSLFVELPVGEADGAARHRRVVERAKELKHGSQRAGGKTIIDLADMGPPLAGELLARSMFGGTRMFNLTITNVPGPQEQLYASGAPLVEILPLVPLFAGHSIGIAVVTYAGQMVFGLNADRLTAPDVGVLAEGIERSFAELRGTGARAATRRRKRSAKAG